MDNRIPTYHIIGGGISGLSAAKFIKQKNTKANVVIYEAASHVGGRCYSFYSDKLQRNIDNATHVILGANKECRKLILQKDFHKKINFWKNDKIHTSPWLELPLILRSIFNTNAQDISKSLIKSLIFKLFPFLPFQTKMYYSHGDLSQNLVDSLKKYADEIRYGWVLKSYESQDNKISSLLFNKDNVKINDNDIVISALDAHNYHKIFNGPKFDFNTIINIFYRTSVELTLPKNIPFIGLSDAIADWVFINKDVVCVTISDANGVNFSDDELARKVWQEIRQINHIQAAFLPPYQIIKHKKATIKQDEKNQALRANFHHPDFSNFQVIGDWTMKNYPCCLEAAIKSAKGI